MVIKTKTSHYVFDGMKALPLQSFDQSGWAVGNDLADDEASDGSLSVAQAYRLVPYLHRAVDIRARAIAGIPWGLYRMDTDAPPDAPPQDVQHEPAWQGITRGMRQRLYQTELSLCLFGESYWLKETNRLGLNLTPRWVVSGSITPRFDPSRGLVGFDRTWGDGVQSLGAEQVVFFWLPNPTTELGPGTAPAQVALSAARLLSNLDQFASRFFQRGAIKATLLTVEGNPPKAEMERLEQWWRRMLGGVRSAWQSVAVRSTVKPVTIGEGLAEAQNHELTRQQRENICAALGVPHSLLSADAANYATARQDKVNFLLNTVLPEARMIEETINDQLCRSIGVRFAFHPEQLEELQQYEAEKARSLSVMVGEPVMTVDEARRWFGLNARTDSETTGADTARTVSKEVQTSDADRDTHTGTDTDTR